MQDIRCYLSLHDSLSCNKSLRELKTETMIKQVLNLQAEIGTGGEQIINSEENGAISASAEVDCGNDAKLTFMGM